MKALITKVEFLEKKEGKGGWKPEYNYKIHYNKKFAYYKSKGEEQSRFTEGQEAEFLEEERTSKTGNVYYNISDRNTNSGSGWSKNKAKEQARYSGFAVSYSKDLVVAGKIELKDLIKHSTELFNHMVALDKTLDQ